MKKTYKEFQEQVLEKTLSPQDIDDLIDKSIEGVTAIKNDKKRNKEDVSTAKSVLKWLQSVVQPLRRRVHFIHQLFCPS